MRTFQGDFILRCVPGATVLVQKITLLLNPPWPLYSYHTPKADCHKHTLQQVWCNRVYVCMHTQNWLFWNLWERPRDIQVWEELEKSLVGSPSEQRLQGKKNAQVTQWQQRHFRPLAEVNDHKPHEPWGLPEGWRREVLPLLFLQNKIKQKLKPKRKTSHHLYTVLQQSGRQHPHSEEVIVVE